MQLVDRYMDEDAVVHEKYSDVNGAKYTFKFCGQVIKEIWCNNEEKVVKMVEYDLNGKIIIDSLIH